MSAKTIAACLFVACALGACQPVEVIKNPEIERWCGDRPCFWTVTGKVERVGTWHPDDYAIALVSDHAELSQYGQASPNDVGLCFHLSMLSKVDPGVRLYLDVDFEPGAKLDWSRSVPESDYAPMHADIAPPTWYKRVRFVVRKEGPGRAVIAKLRVLADHEACAGAPIELDQRPAGASCEDDSQCENADCRYGQCSCADAGAALCTCTDDDGGC